MTASLATTFAGLADPRVSKVLEGLHRQARGDIWVFVRALPAIAGAALSGKPAIDAAKPHLKNAYIPVTPDQGRLLYLAARSIRAKRIVEFGTSFGISAIYLAAAAKANGGSFIGTELEPNKIAVARRNLAEAGLSDVAEVREGDALETLVSVQSPVDFLLLDGWKELYQEIIALMAPKMRPGAIVLADNISTFKKTLKPYVDWMQDRRNGFESATVAIGHGMEFSLKL